jgi:hypothetical protein
VLLALLTVIPQNVYQTAIINKSDVYEDY